MLPQLIDNDQLLSSVELVFEHFILLKFISDSSGYFSISKNRFPPVQIAYGTDNAGNKDSLIFKILSETSACYRVCMSNILYIAILRTHF